ncbi:hypothetical protein THAOC_17839, partial [Thalassiosira oceanica]
FVGIEAPLVALPNGLEELGSRAFVLSDAHNVRVPASLIELPEEAVWTNKSLLSVEIAGAVERIGAEAFHGDIVLRNIAIPASCEVAPDAFASCTDLTDTLQEHEGDRDRPKDPLQRTARARAPLPSVPSAGGRGPGAAEDHGQRTVGLQVPPERGGGNADWVGCQPGWYGHDPPAHPGVLVPTDGGYAPHPDREIPRGSVRERLLGRPSDPLRDVQRRVKGGPGLPHEISLQPALACMLRPTSSCRRRGAGDRSECPARGHISPGGPVRGEVRRARRAAVRPRARGLEGKDGDLDPRDRSDAEAMQEEEQGRRGDLSVPVPRRLRRAAGDPERAALPDGGRGARVRAGGLRL